MGDRQMMEYADELATQDEVATRRDARPCVARACVARACALLLASLLMAVAGCTSDGGTSHDGGADAMLTMDSGVDSSEDAASPVDAAAACDLPVFDRSCATVDDCTKAIHHADCCGTENPLGINQSERARFDAFDSACRATYADCGCGSMYPVADDGTTTTSMQSAAEATLQCLAGVCTTTYAP